MNPITNVVVALFGAEQKQILRITGTDKNNANISITDANVMTGSFGIDRYSCNGDKLEIGTAIAAQMTCKLNNADGTFDNIVFEGTELLVEIGIADWSQQNPTVSYVPCGYFTPDEQPRRLSTISLTCLDRMTKFDAVVDQTALTLPATVAGLVGQVCTICGITLARDISSLPNASVSIAALPTVQGDMTYRNLIQWCAGIMATNAWINWSGNLEFSWYNNSTSYMMTTANRYNSDLYEDDLTVTGVTYTNNSGVEIVEGTDDYAIDLTGNALAGPLISTVLPAINTALNGFTYRPFSAVVVNAPYLWPMDVVVYKDKDGNNHTSVLTNVAFGLNGTTALESRGMTAAMNARKQPKGVTKEQAQIITEAMQVVEKDIDESLTQQEIFNRLTDGGQNQGIYLLNGKVYVDATYILTGYLEATRIRGGTLTLGGLNNVNGTMEVLDASGNVVGTVTKNGFYAADTVNGAVRSATLADGMVFFKYDGQNTGRLLSGSTSGTDYLLINGPDSSGSSVLSALDFWGDGSAHLAAGDQVAALDLHADGSIGINSSDDISATADGDISATADGNLHLHSGGDASLYLTAAGNAEIRSTNGAAALILKPDGSIEASNSLTVPWLIAKSGERHTCIQMRDINGVPRGYIYSDGQTGSIFFRSINPNVPSGQVGSVYTDYTLPASEKVSSSNPKSVSYKIYSERDTIPVDHGGTGATSVTNAVKNLGLSMAFNGSDWTLATMYPDMSKVPVPGSVFLWLSPTSVGLLSGNSVSKWCTCIASRTNASDWRFLAFTNDGYIYNWGMSGWSSASATPTFGTVNRIAVQRTKSVTATTDSNGNISLGLAVASYHVLSVKASSLIATPWVSSDDNWHAHVTAVNGNAYANTSVTVTAIYTLA